MTDFNLLYTDLIENVINNNLEQVKSLVSQINDYQLSVTEIDEYVTKIILGEDIYSLRNITEFNESFLYLIYNLNSDNEWTKQALWSMKILHIKDQYTKKIIDDNELNNQIEELYHNITTLTDLQYLDLIRLSLLTKNYSFIQKIKEHYLNIKE